MDVSPGDFPLAVRASKGDTSSTIEVVLVSRQGLLSVPAVTTAFVWGRNAAGTACEALGSLSLTGGVVSVSFDLTAAMTAVKGRTALEIVLSSGGYQLVTGTFYIDVR